VRQSSDDEGEGPSRTETRRAAGTDAQRVDRKSEGGRGGERGVERVGGDDLMEASSAGPSRDWADGSTR